MLRVRKMERSDFPFALELANAMEWNMTAEDYEFNMTLEPNGCFVLEADLKLIGVATSINYGQVGWFGNLVIEESYRRKGAGTILVKHAVNYLKNSGVTVVGLYAYPYLESFYGKLGFRGDMDFVFLKAEAVSSVSVPNKDLKAIESVDLPKVVCFDNRFFGPSREKLLNSIFLNPTNIGYCAFQQSELVGYAGAKIYGETAEIGPLVCRRDHFETGLSLFRIILSRLDGVGGFMYLPVSETVLLKAAFEAGFKQEFLLRRMFLGFVPFQDCVYIAESLERG